MNAPPRIVTALSLVQCFAILFGVFWTRWCLGFYDRFGAPPFSKIDGIPPSLAFARSCGFWFLLVPVIWTGFAVVSADLRGGTVELTLKQLVIGIALTVALCLFFGLSALRSSAYV